MAEKRFYGSRIARLGAIELRCGRSARTPAPSVRQQRTIVVQLQQFAQGVAAEYRDLAVDDHFEIVNVIQFQPLFGFFGLGFRNFRARDIQKRSGEHAKGA